MENFATYRLTQTGPETQAILDQVNTNTADIAQLQAAYEALTQSEPVIIQPSDTWPVADPEENVIYRVIDRVNTPPESYSDYMWNGTAMVLMATYDNAIDSTPTAGSNNPVASGGVLDYVSTNGSAYDISAANSGTAYADLAAALGTDGANVPAAVRRGGMSVKFVQSSDNTYVQYRYMLSDVSTAATFTNVSNWQGVTREVKAGSKDLVKSGGVYNSLQPLKEKTGNIKIVELPADEEYIKITKNDGEVIVQIDLNGLVAKKIASNELYILDGEILTPVALGTSVVTDNVSNLSFCDEYGNPIMKIGVDGNLNTIAFSSEKTRMSKYKGKTTLYVGDSISTKNSYHWKGMLEDVYGVKYARYDTSDPTTVTPAAGGITLRPHTDDPTRPMNQTVGQSAKSIFWRCCEHRLDIYDFDSINLFGGTNDCSSTLNIGTVNDEPLLDTDIEDWSTFDFDSVSFASAYKGCIEMLRRDFPNIEIITNTLLSSNLANSEEVSKLIVSISNLYGLKCVPWRWSSINGNNLAVMTLDGVHPSLTGGRVMAGFYANIIGF